MFKHAASVRPPGAASREDPSLGYFGVPPFVVRHAQQNALPDGRFTPAALVAFTPGLRASGLLAALPGEEIKTLLAVLSCVTPNGRIEPSLPEVAQVLNVSESKARDRLLRLQTLLWQGEPLIHSRQRELGLDVFVPAPTLVGTGPEELPAPHAAAEPERSSSSGANRDAIIAHSRAAYARPRAEVERLVAEQLGHVADGTLGTPEGSVRRRLWALGVPDDSVECLLSNHPVEVIAEQLDWLPHRHAKNPARLIVAAIEHRYEPPARVRLERAIAADTAAEEAAQEQAEPNAEPVTEPAGVPDAPIAETDGMVSLPIPTEAGTETSEGDSDAA
jgi:hypothetical protein